MSESIDTEFATAIEPLRGALRVHCYRMLGTAHDSDDMVQETLLRAWRARETLADPQRLRPWLFRIATNACLDELARRPRRVLASDVSAPTPGNEYPPSPAGDEIPWLEPMPDAWLTRDHDPAARYALRESVALAFVAALQVLSPAQRAVLVLRDVIGFTAEETADTLDQSVSATKSLLHRARTAIEGSTPAAFVDVAPEPVVAQYVRAIAEHDIDAMLALLHDDIHTTMPPSPTWVAGRAENELFYRRMFKGWTPGDVHVVPIGVNGGVGFEFHRGGVLRAIEAVEIRDGRIYRMHHFMQPRVVALFSA